MSDAGKTWVAVMVSCATAGRAVNAQSAAAAILKEIFTVYPLPFIPLWWLDVT